MDSGSVFSEPISAHRSFTKQKSASMTILNTKSCAAAAAAAAKYNHHNHQDHIEAKMTNITQCATVGRRRKGTSLGGTLSTRSSRSEAKELRSALQDREAVIQNLRIQLCLGKLPRPTGPPLTDTEKPAAEQKLVRLTAEAENKKIKIRNLKSALEKLDITDNIDIRIRQAELEYALGREELQMLSIVEEARALQARLEKSKPEAQTLFSVISSGVPYSLHAIHATTGRWAIKTNSDQPGIYIDWALEGDGIYKGDRILEVNGVIVTSETKEELQKIVGNSGRCQMVVLRRKPAAIPQKQLDQEKENNIRLQHRISYLEEQVKELQTAKEQQSVNHTHTPSHTSSESTTHVTSISITSPPSTPPEKPMIFQRGNYITTLVGGKPIELVGNTSTSNGTNSANKLSKSNSAAHITKTLIKESRATHETNGDAHHRTLHSYMPSKSLSASKISINSDSAYIQSNYKRERDHLRERDRDRYEKSVSKTSALQHRAQMQARSVEHLNQFNGYLERRREVPRSTEMHAHTLRTPSKTHLDMRSVKSLDFDSENDGKLNSADSQSEVGRTLRPTPPKKPLRLSLQRAQSLQTVELNQAAENDRKRPMKRAHITDRNASSSEGVLIENTNLSQTSSLGRQKTNI